MNRIELYKFRIFNRDESRYCILSIIEETFEKARLKAQLIGDSVLLYRAEFRNSKILWELE